ncbi:MAG: 50S ribosomal protein L10 [Dehalococcoidia bacterium]
MPTRRKIELVEELQERFSRCSIAIATDCTGLPVFALTELRQRLRQQGVEYKVIKNSLARIAADAIGRPQLKEIIQGPTALALGYSDPVEAARALDQYIKSTRSTLVVKSAVMDTHVLTPAQVTRLATLPSREQLLARLLGQMQSPIARLINILNAPLVSLVTLLQRRVEQGERPTG